MNELTKKETALSSTSKSTFRSSSMVVGGWGGGAKSRGRLDRGSFFTSSLTNDADLMKSNYSGASEGKSGKSATKV